MSTPTFKVGDEVQWAHVTGKRTISIKTKYGTITALAEATATIKVYHSSRHVNVALRRLKPRAGTSPVKDFFDGFANAAAQS